MSDPITEAVLSTSLDAVMVIDDAGIITAWNGNAEKIFGYAAGDAVGRQMRDVIIPPEHRAAHQAGMSRFLLTGEVRILGRRVKLAALHRAGHEIPVELAVTMHSAVGGRHFLGFVRDLTAEMEAEANIRRLNAEVLQLSRLNAMGTAASMIAHELSQPLAAATNYLSICQRALSDSNRNADVLLSSVSEAQAAIFRAAEVLKIIRDIVGARPLRRLRVPLSLLISESLTLIKSSLPVEPVITISPGSEVVLVAKGPAEQVLLNILKNAAEALIGHPDPRLDCSARRVGSFVEICIADNGAGVPEEARSKLFSPNTSTKKGGLGIGLSICREIIENHGGRIWCESEPSRTKFCFTLPAAVNSKVTTVRK
ncbi:PAS domain S-box protein [Sphingomonas kaistensis]|uniref:histidine kinase n=1 Tax=Sphingomonas kaistensis TaxID=298708 RepID=A0ABZ2G457_9SPHN